MVIDRNIIVVNFNDMHKLRRCVFNLLLSIISFLSWNSFNVYADIVITSPLKKEVILSQNIVNGKNVLNQSMITDEQTVYIIRYKYDIVDDEIIIPKDCELRFEGGSINYGSLRLNSNTKIYGNGCTCKISSKGLSHKNFIIAENVENIEINEICLEGEYDNSRNIDPWIKNGDAENPIFIKDSSHIVFNRVGISCFANDNKGPYSLYWDKDDCKYGFAAIKMFACKDVLFEDCYERESAGEAWEWTLCQDVKVDGLSMIRTYGVSSINVQACDSFTIQNSELVNDNCQGNIVNFTTANSCFSNNYVEVRFKDESLASNGLIDFGNEFVNRRLNYYLDFVVQNNTFDNNTLRNSGFTNASEWQGSVSVNIKGITFFNNTVIKDTSIGASLVFVHLGHYQGVEDVAIKNNFVEFINTPKENIYKRYQCIIGWSGKSEWNTYKGHVFHVKNLLITDNTFLDSSFSRDFDSYNRKFLEGPYGIIVLREASDVMIQNNRFYDVLCPVYSTTKKVNADSLIDNIIRSRFDAVFR